VAELDRPGRLGWVAPVTVLLLLALTLAAFGLSQRLKREPLLIDRVSYLAEGAPEGDRSRTIFTPNGDCRRDRIAIRFRATRSDIATISVVTAKRQPVRTLARARFLRRYREYRFFWDGRTADGRTAPSGRYRVRVQLRQNDRDLVLPGKIRLRKRQAGPLTCEGGNRPGAGGTP
jgi:hypothetical protein